MNGEYRDIHFSSDALANNLSIINSSNMSERQKKQIKEFVNVLKIGKAGKKVKDRRISNYIQFLSKLNNYFEKDLDKITEKEAEKLYRDLEDNKIKKQNGMPYAQASKDEFVKTLKRFLGWVWGNKTLKYRKTLSWMKEEYKKSNKKAITLKDCEKIISKEKYLRNVALFDGLFDSGARIEEWLNVKINDLTRTSDNKYFKVHLRGTKTEEADRTIALPICSKHLSKWLKEHPTKEDDDYLFPIKYDNARKIIKQMSKKVLGYEIKPHELRHSSATHYIQFGGFGAENIGGFYYRYGWKFGSKEALTYIKTYLYSGEIGTEKVIKAIENNKVDELEKDVTELKNTLKLVMKELSGYHNQAKEREKVFKLTSI